MSTILGIDPGANTGVAHIVGGELIKLQTIAPHEIERTLREAAPDRVVFEDSRLLGTFRDFALAVNAATEARASAFGEFASQFGCDAAMVAWPYRGAK